MGMLNKKVIKYLKKKTHKYILCLYGFSSMRVNFCTHFVTMHPARPKAVNP